MTSRLQGKGDTCVARDVLEFVKAALRNPLNVSTVFPTSQALAETLLARGDLRGAARVAELGAGTGAITKHLAARLKHPEVYLGVELDPQMVEFLKQKFPGLKFATGLAQDLCQWVPEQSVDVVVSSLPWTIFSNETQTKTIDAIVRALKPGGVFLTYICVNAMAYPQARGFIERLKNGFSDVTRSPLEWRNIPPAFVFQAKK